MLIHLRDLNSRLVDAWEKQFADEPDVQVSAGDIFGVRCDGIVSPANSFGYMDGGIDLAYSHHFGWELQSRLQAVLQEHHGGELPVGQAVIVATGNEDIPWLISAPTMRVPRDVGDSVNAYLAFRAALRAVEEHNRISDQPIRSVLCPGLATAIGRMPPERCALQMHAALLSVRGQPPMRPGELRQLDHVMRTR